MKKEVIILLLVMLMSGCKEAVRLSEENCLKYQQVTIEACMPSKDQNPENFMFFIECTKKNSDKFFAEFTLEEIKEFQEFCSEKGVDVEKEKASKSTEGLMDLFKGGGYKDGRSWVPEERKTFKGEGNQKTEKMLINNFAKDLRGGGIVRAQMKHAGTSIKIYLVDAQTNEKKQVNKRPEEIVDSLLITLEKEGEYFFEVEADGKWEIIVITGGYLK